MKRQAQSEWQPPETAPKDGRPFLITTAGPEVDICVWVKERKRFEDYYFKQGIPQEWPSMVAWKRLGAPAAVEDTEADSRAKNGFPVGRRRAA